MPEFFETPVEPWTTNPQIEAGQAEPYTLKLIDGDGPGYVPTNSLDDTAAEEVEVRYHENTELDFAPAAIDASSPRNAGWIFFIVAAAVLYFSSEGSKDGS